MSDQDNAQEPTMEEILASIRRIISEEGDDAAPEEVPEEVEEPEVEEDVLELTEKLDEPVEPEPEPEVEIEDDLVMVDSEPEPEEELEVMEEPAAAAAFDEEDFDLPPVEGDNLLGEIEASATATTFASLKRTVEIYDGDINTLEGLVREILKPVLKQWLDENLPSVVDRLVQKEIDRVSRTTD